MARKSESRQFYLFGALGKNSQHQHHGYESVQSQTFASCCHMSAEYGRRDAEEIASGAPSSEVAQPLESLANTDLVASLNTATTNCEQWRDDFSMRAATLLQDLRTVAALAREILRSGEDADKVSHVA